MRISIKKGFSLVEIMVALAVLALAISGVASGVVSVQNAWARQRSTGLLIMNTRWAMEFIANDVRYATLPQISAQTGPDQCSFGIDTDGDGTNGPEQSVWYWRGDGGTYGSTDIIYRGTAGPAGLLDTANTNRKEILNYVVNNTSGYSIFTLVNNILSIEITVRPTPAQAAGYLNQNYSLRTMARPRN